MWRSNASALAAALEVNANASDCLDEDARLGSRRSGTNLAYQVAKTVSGMSARWALVVNGKGAGMPGEHPTPDAKANPSSPSLGGALETLGPASAVMPAVPVQAESLYGSGQSTSQMCAVCAEYRTRVVAGRRPEEWLLTERFASRDQCFSLAD